MTPDVHAVAAEPLTAESLELPVACSLSEGDLRRRGEDIADLFVHAVAATEYPDGYGFAFPAEEGRTRQLLDFVVFERACCPFFTFALTFPSPHDVVWLQLRGGSEAKDMVTDQFVAVRDRLAAARP